MCVDLAVLCAEDAEPTPAQWVSVLPTGPLGDVVAACAADAGVDTSQIVRV